MLEINNLSKQFGDKRALNGVSCSVKSGEIMCLLGANGAGKSTTVNLCLGFIKPDSGTISIDGELVDFDKKESLANSRQKLVYIPEQMNLYQDFNAIENIQYLAKLSDISPNVNEIQEALTATGLESAAWNKPLKNYSKGMRQKVGIAFAIVRKAKVLLLDEPTSGLDPSATIEFINIIKKLAEKGAAIFMVTHDFYCAHSLANKIGIMNQGNMVEFLDNNQLSLSSLEQIYHQSVNPVSSSKVA
ncbi:ABC transporter ATP-binding protein [Thalassotalea marina]|uniref:ABC transporter ATP-binding protein n=1 Tax=Thalassotalea marina TaxID=1673741 RepID=A0A919BAM1_9GAMM|nr:ABC transporter ATP-binding protein [Thalassotalea marina]GHF77944.1 ABC transporter ATP-binding protein [Thalassotalea marina]